MDEPSLMALKVLLPTRVLVEEPVRKIIAEGEHGSFCLLPRHVDFVAVLLPGILSFWGLDARESLLAADRGVLVKCGTDVVISTRDATRHHDLARLSAIVERRLHHLDEQERLTRTALARLEAGVLRRFVEIEERGRG